MSSTRFFLTKELLVEDKTRDSASLEPGGNSKKNSSKKVEEKFSKFSIEKKSNKKIAIFDQKISKFFRNFDLKNLPNKTQKNFEKSGEQNRKILENFQIFPIFSPLFSNFFWVLFGKFFKSKISKMFSKNLEKFSKFPI